MYVCTHSDALSQSTHAHTLTLSTLTHTHSHTHRTRRGSHSRILSHSIILSHSLILSHAQDKTGFRTKSDCEVVVHMYKEIGEDVASHLDGVCVCVFVRMCLDVCVYVCACATRVCVHVCACATRVCVHVCVRSARLMCVFFFLQISFSYTALHTTRDPKS